MTCVGGLRAAGLHTATRRGWPGAVPSAFAGMSTPVQELPGGMVSTGIGERLRSARQALGLSLEEIENVTRIRRSFLVALEQEAFDLLPGPAYVRGFLRTYAAYLGIPSAELLDLYPTPSVGTKAGAIAPREFPVEVRITPATRLAPGRRVLVGAGILVGLGVVALGVVLYEQVRQFAETPVSPPGPAAPRAGPSNSYAAPTSGSPRLTPSAPPPGAPPRSTPSGASAIPQKPPATPGPAASGPAASPPKPATPPRPGPTSGTGAPPASTTSGAPGAPPKPPATPSPGAPPGSGPAAPSSPAPAPLHVVVAASGHSWVRTVADGTTVFEGFVNVGDKQIWEAKRTLTVKVGNASAVDISLNGKSLGRLGASGQVYEHTFSAGPATP